MAISVIATAGLFPGSSGFGWIPGPASILLDDDMADNIDYLLSIQIVNSQLDEEGFLGDESRMERAKSRQEQHFERPVTDAVPHDLIGSAGDD